MNYQTHNSRDISAQGTWLQGHIDVEFDQLVSRFGAPLDGDCYKTDAEWIIEFSDGTIAAIYNWKNGRSYLGHDGPSVGSINHWNIGGTSKRAVDLIHQVIFGNSN